MRTLLTLAPSAFALAVVITIAAVAAQLVKVIA